MAKYCSNCGDKVNDQQDVCLSCGYRLKHSNHVVEGDTIGWAVLGFFFPLVGLILYLVWKEERPKASLSAGKGALISVVAHFALMAFMVTVMFSIGY